MIPIYRIWDKRTGKWMNVQEAIISNGEVYESWRDFEDGRSLTEDDYVFVHSTGVKDKSDVEIFDGYVGWDDHQEVYGKVSFEDGKFVYEWENVCNDLCEVNADIEIVGNIFQNPELLEAER